MRRGRHCWALLSSNRMQDCASLSRCTPKWFVRAVDINIHFAAASRIMCGQLRGLTEPERLKFCFPEIVRCPNNLIDGRSLKLAATGYYLDIPIPNDPCQEVRRPDPFQRILLQPQSMNLCSWVCTRLETYCVGLRVTAAAPEAAAYSTPSQSKVEGGQRALEARPVCRRGKGRGGRPVVPFCVSQPVVDR